MYALLVLVLVLVPVLVLVHGGSRLTEDEFLYLGNNTNKKQRSC